jgi:hypothetical protein
VKTAVIFLTLIFGYCVLVQSQDCLKYRPSLVKISGVIERDTFPGCPNYENIKEGDEIEIYWILKLSKPVCVIGTTGDDINTSENNIDKLQLILTDGQYKNYLGFIGHEVVVSGTLFHSHTAHHKTIVLINVFKMIAA